MNYENETERTANAVIVGIMVTLVAIIQLGGLL